ncbi:transposase [Ferruginibacter albus]|uniref:transposase n=1 Tax=Ferruginibacter albus TaxID=2875540 RepID=UPI001CC7BAE9|nr:transposase [Ferruginibacter albus]UAY50624.1 transposase [Ferruginibacter albus]
MQTTQRKSFTAIGNIYFWTATIHKWYPLLQNDTEKKLIADSLKTLSDKGAITVYAFVIMPNHIHLIWQLNAPNGKESAKGSFLKFTAHEFKKMLKLSGGLENYKVDAANKEYQFWQRDSLGIEIWSREVAKQKLNYIHNNPVSGKWQLAKNDISYYYSSAKFYEDGIDEFGFLNNLFKVFDGD